MTASRGPRSRRSQLVIDRRLATTFRALSADVDVDLWEHRPADSNGLIPMNAPHLYPLPATSTMASLRGAADAMSMRQLNSDLDCHRRTLPETPVERLVVEMLEQYRCESLATLPGVRSNLRDRHEEWSEEYLGSRLQETYLGILLFTVALVSRSAVTGDPISDPHSDLIEATRFELATELGPFLVRLRRTRTDQCSFAEVARELAVMIASRVKALEEREAGRATRRGGPRDSRLPLVFDVAEDLFAQGSNTSSGPVSVVQPYRIWDAGFDTVSTVSSLVRPAQLSELRTAVTAEVSRNAIALAPVIARLQSVVLTVHDEFDLVDSDSGVLDSTRLARLITSPGETRVFRGPVEREHPDCLVTFLIDCSGSMKTHALGVAAMLDVLVTALDRLGAATELLGFTTGSWNGGRARQTWRKAGAPQRPGRLNEVHHIVFKDADKLLRRARRDLGGLLKTSLFREGVDGEAIRWAAQRISNRQASRSVLVIVSDGTPADSATAEANDENFLSRDLVRTLAELHRRRDISVVGVGIDSDPSPFYRTSISLDSQEMGGRASIRSIVDALRTVLQPG